MTTASQPGLLEREAELAAIGDALGGAAEGRGAGLLIVGASGLGKTSLLSAAAQRGHEDGLRVLRARGEELECDFPWGVAVQLFAPAARDSDSDAVFAGAAGLARGLVEGAAVPPASSGDAFPLLHGLHWLAANLSERVPLLLLLDDVHWSDPETLLYLSYLLARIEELAVCVIVAERDGEPLEPTRSELLARLHTHPSTTTRTLRPLASEAVGRLVRAELPEAGPEFCTAIEDVAGGNPFLVRELVRAAREEGIEPTGVGAERLRGLHPRAIHDSILLRLGRLGEDAGRLGTAAAILGPQAPLRLLRDLAGLDEPAGTEAAASLVGAGILEGADRLSFVHPIVREAVYADLAPPRRVAAHGDAARLLHEAAAPVQQVAAQLVQSDPVREGWAAPVLREAAARAAARGAPVGAVRLLRRALDEPGGRADPELLLELGRVEVILGQPDAIGHLEAAERMADGPVTRAATLATLARARYMVGDTEGAVDAGRGALEQISPGTGGDAEADLLTHYVMAARAVPTLVDDASQLLARPRSGRDGEPTPGEVVRLILAAWDAFLRGDHEAARAGVRDAGGHLADDRLIDHVPFSAQVMLMEVRTLLGQHRETEREATRHVEAAQRSGARLELAMALESRAASRWCGGDLPGAIADVERALSLSEGSWDVTTVVLRVFGAIALLEQGDDDTASQTLELPETVEAQLPGSWGWFWLPYGRGVLALSRGEWAKARDQALVAGDRLRAIRAPTPGFVPWRPLAARAAARLGERDEALSLAGEVVEAAQAARAAPATIGIALATLGVVEEGEEAIDALREATELLGASARPLEHARALVDLGAALRRAGWDREARERLREGLALARTYGARAVGERAVDELVAAGARVPRLELSGVASLTPSERRVAEMAAQELSNREIAEALFVTRRTVETHLSHTYAKLGIGSRAELRNALAGSTAKS